MLMVEAYILLTGRFQCKIFKKMYKNEYMLMVEAYMLLTGRFQCKMFKKNVQK